MNQEPEQDPVVAYDAEWGHHMRAARKVLGLSQTSLAAKVGVSQPVISTIERGGETGTGGSSNAIMRICQVLGIQAPVLTEDPRMKRWRAVGEALMTAPHLFDTQLQYMETFVEEIIKHRKS